MPKNAFWILVLCAWGCIGITQTSFGFHNVWEFWAYQAFYGVAVCPWYAISQTMISEVVPRGKEVRRLPVTSCKAEAEQLDTVSLLRFVFYHRENIIVHWAFRLQCHH